MDNVDLTLYDGLIEEELENETWKVCLTIVVPHQTFDEELVIGFSKAVLLGHRKSIVNVSLETLLSEAKLYGTAVAKKARGAPKFTEICDVIKNRFESNQPFPATLLALLIKFHLIRIRNQVQQQKSKEPGRVKTIRQKKNNPKRPTSSQSELEPPSAKEPSKMRKHGDEPDVDKETDDERNNGITQYILLTGFFDPKIIEELISVGVSVHNIIKISVAEEAALKILVQRKLQEKMSLLPVGQVAEAEKVAECQRTEKQKALNRFWEKLEEELDFQFASGRLRDVVALNYIVRPQILPDSLSDEQAVVDCGKVIYDELLAIIYDLVDFRRQWQNYLAHIKLFAIPRLPECQRRPRRDPANTSRQSNSGASKAKNSIVDDDFVEMSTYNCILKDYALENIQPELVLYAILEQVVESESIKEKVVERLPPIPEKALKHISVTVKSLLFEDQQLQFLAQQLPDLKSELLKREEKNSVPPPPTNAADKLSLRLGSSENAKNTRKSILDLMETTLQTKGCTILSKNDGNAGEALDERTKWHFARQQQLLYFAARQGISDEDFSEILNQLYMESIDFAPVSDPGAKTPEHDPLNTPALQGKTVEPPCRINPFDDPYIPIPLLAEALLLEEESIIQTTQQAQIDSRIAEVTESSEFSSSESLGNSDTRSHSDKPGILRSASSGRSRSRSASRKSSVVRFTCEQADLSSRSINDDAQSIVGENLRTPLVELLVNQEGLLNPHDATEAGQNESLFHIGSATIKELLKSTQKRDLSNWCLREKLTKDQFIQRAFELLFEFPYVKIFKQRRNNGELVVLHKNVDCRLPSSYNSQSSWMHTSDLGFRAYLQTISDKIASWTNEQEAFYQATLLSNEIKMATQETIETPKSASTQKGQKVRTKTKTNKKGRNSISKGETLLETVVEKEIFDENGEYIVKGSLKDEQRKKAKQEQQQQKLATVIERPPTVTEKVKTSKFTKGKTDSVHMRSPPTVVDATMEVKLDEDRMVELPSEQFWPFTGYDLTETVAHFDFQETSMFPSDGGSIRTQKMQQPHGNTNLKITTITEGHTFTCHRPLPPSAKKLKQSLDEVIENKLDESDGKSAGFEEGMTHFTTYFSANLSNGVCLARTFDTDNTSPEAVKDPSTADFEKSQEASGPIIEQHFKLNLSTPEGCQMEYSALRHKNIANDDGLHPSGVLSTSAMLEMSKMSTASSPSVRSSVRPSVYHDKAIELYGDNTVDRRSSDAEREVKRILLGNGVVIQLLEKVGFESSTGVRILFPDGSVAETETVRAALYFCENPPKFPESTNTPFESYTSHLSIPPVNSEANPAETHRRASRKHSSVQSKPPTRSLKGRLPSSTFLAKDPVPMQTNLPRSPESKSLLWLLTLHSGERFWAKLATGPWPNRENSQDTTTDQSNQDVTSASTCRPAATKWLIDGCTCFHVRRMFDPSTGQTLCTRFVDDLLRVEKGPEGREGVTVQHLDGIRQTTLYYSNGKDSNCQEKSRFVQVECPGFPTVVINLTTNEMKILLVSAEGTRALAFADPQGYFAYRCGDKSEVQFHHNGNVVYMTHGTTNSAENHISNYVFSFLKSENLLEVTDSENNTFSVDNFGNCNALLDDKGQFVEADAHQGQGGVTPPLYKDVVNRHPQAFHFFSVSADGQTIIEHISPYESARLRRSSKTVGLPEISASDLSSESFDTFENDSFASGERWLTTSNTGSFDRLYPRDHQTTYMEPSIIPSGLTIQNLNFALMNSKGSRRSGTSDGTIAVNLDAVHMPCDHKVYRRRYHKEPLSPQKRERFYNAHVEYVEHCLLRLVYWGQHSFSLNEAGRSRTCFVSSLAFPSAVDGMLARTSVSDDRKDSLYNRRGSPHASITCARFPDVDDLTQEVNEELQGSWQNRRRRRRRREGEERKKEKDEEGGDMKEQPIEQSQAAAFISRLRNAIAEAAINREILRQKFVPNYFHSPKGKEFLKQQAPLVSDKSGGEDVKMDTTQLNAQLLGPRRNGHRSTDGASQLEPDAPAIDTIKAKSSAKKDSVRSRSKTSKPPLVFPRAQIKPAVQRKYDSNPNFVYYWGVQDELVDPEELCITSEGTPQTLVKTPNLHQAIVEDPYRLKVLNTGTVGRPVEGKLALRRLRGLRILPEVVDFGRMQFGRCYTTHITLFNGGVEPTNAWIRDPPKSLKLSVSYTKGQIAAGLSRKVTITFKPTYDDKFLNYLDRIEDSLFSLTVSLQIRTDTHNIILPILGKLTGDAAPKLPQRATVLPEINNGFAV